MALVHSDIAGMLNSQIVPIAKEATGQTVDIELLLADKLLLSRTIQYGLPYHFFEIALSYNPYTMEEWTAFLEISSKTIFRNRHSDKRFKRFQSERILSLTEITMKGLAVFRSIDKLRDWLLEPNAALDQCWPMDLIGDAYGKDLVLAELSR